MKMRCFYCSVHCTVQAYYESSQYSSNFVVKGHFVIIGTFLIVL